MNELKISKTAVKIPAEASLASVLEQLDGFGAGVIVNVAPAANGETILFTEENLQALLEQGVNELHIETVAGEQYLEMVHHLATRLIEQVDELRKRLRNYYVTDISEPVNNFLWQLQNVTSMLKCLVMRKQWAPLADDVGTLTRLRGQLGEAALYFEDNARCLDDLEFEILPCLKKIIAKLSDFLRSSRGSRA